ncbi:adenosine-specific kinase [Candidatus Nitronereus thalassa]|uniref:Adenosine-specific kinase n=1 Tax=Candidatus Nitronereus thalassa TaxID=3020898 RepID=A0ABU3K8X9_9BACT|nr:adenosine-specific kinase [Candidatus Nitronereus thalassa]MDT7042773.1 adenosine-specific kinase [Candidatus Nitronereus thalassa]
MSIQFIPHTIQKPEDVNVIMGQAHFIKTVEGLHEALVTAVPNIAFGVVDGSPPQGIEPEQDIANCKALFR